MPTSLWPVLKKALTADPAVIESLSNRTANFFQPLGGTNLATQDMRAAYQRAQAATYAWMYINQPAVRTVVDLIAENVSQLGMKLYERISETERRADDEHPAALSVAYPNDATPSDQWIFEMVADYLVYDNAYALKFLRGPGEPISLITLRPHLVAVLGQGYAVTGYRVYRTTPAPAANTFGGAYEDFPPDRVVHFRRYNPQDPRVGISRLETLRQELTEDAAIQAATTQIARDGLKGGYIKRPLEAPEWSGEARSRFAESWRNRKRRSPTEDPILEEGMEFINTMISPRDAELLSARKATTERVAQLYGVPVAQLTGEGRRPDDSKRLYTDVLAPVSQKFCKQLDHSITQAVYMDTDRYFEQNLAEKLRGDMEARFAAQTTTTGRPWRTVNEARASENLPPVDNGDGLTIPLNVMIEGQGSPALPAPNVMPPQDPNKPDQGGGYRETPSEPAASGNGKALHLLPRRVSVTSRRSDDAKTFEGLLRRHFARQQRALEYDLAKAADSPKWNLELAADLYRLARKVIAREGQIAAQRMASKFDPRLIVHYQRAAAEGSAAAINAKTEEEILDLGVAKAFENAKGNRAVVGGITQATEVYAWSAKEALHQVHDPETRMVTIAGGECEICAPYQGVWRQEDLGQWPPYHGNCNCLAEVG